jgi:hypothetical protein
MEGPMGVEAWWGDGMRRGLSELRDTRQHWYEHISGFDAVRALWFRVCPGPPRELYRRRARTSTGGPSVAELTHRREMLREFNPYLRRTCALLGAPVALDLLFTFCPGCGWSKVQPQVQPQLVYAYPIEAVKQPLFLRRRI